MKSFIRWANSLSVLDKWGWAFMLILAGVIASFEPVLGFCIVVVLILGMFYDVRHSKRLRTYILILALLLPSPHRREAKAENLECNALIIGGLVVVVFGFCVYKLAKFCKSHFPPQPPPPPPDTNAPPAQTNQPPNVTSSFANLSPSYEPQGYDVSSLGYVDRAIASNPVPFNDLVIVSFSGSTNLTDWTNCATAHVWISSNSAQTILYDWQMRAVCTNRALGNPYTESLTNFLPVPLLDKGQPRFYLRDF